MIIKRVKSNIDLKATNGKVVGQQGHLKVLVISAFIIK